MLDDEARRSAEVFLDHLPVRFCEHLLGCGFITADEEDGCRLEAGREAAEARCEAGYELYAMHRDELDACLRREHAQCNDSGIGSFCPLLGEVDLDKLCDSSTPCSCAGRVCGDDGCGGSCGTCQDNNPCTADSCTDAGTCEFAPIPDSATCTGLELEVCEAGAFAQHDCRELCRSSGFNAAGGCGLEGAEPNVCNCFEFEETCAQTAVTCQDAQTEVGCDRATNSWYLVDCEGACVSRYYDRAIGCREGFGCICEGTRLVGDTPVACTSFGGFCNNSEFCCTGLSCVWRYNGGDSYISCDFSVSNPACDQCLATCRGLPGCCTGTGCLCESECR